MEDHVVLGFDKALLQPQTGDLCPGSCISRIIIWVEYPIIQRLGIGLRRLSIEHASMATLLKLNLLNLHCAYFILTCVIGSVIIYMTSTQIYSLHYADALFMSISAMTGTGLSVVGLSY